MIDDKEIDIAARAQALSKHINETTYFQLRSIEDFKDGAKWAINEFLKALWHPAKEVPNEEKSNILIQFKDGHFYCLDTYRMFNNTNWNSTNGMWDEYNKFVRRYLCIDDLLSKKGGTL